MGKFAFSLILLAIAIGHFAYTKSEYAKRKREDAIIEKYTPSAALQKYSSLAQLTDLSYRLLYLNTPVVSTDKTYIISKCDKHQNSKALTFGCYLPEDNGIYILELGDERYNSVTATTVAHEVLHAAYDRLSMSEKAALKNELQSLYDGKLHAQLDARLQAYVVSGDEFYNELHSIVGTEFTKLSPALEAHYAKYLKNRNGLASHQQKTLSGIKEQHQTIREMQFNLTSLKSEIDEIQDRILHLKQEIDTEQPAVESSPHPQQAVQNFNAKIKAHNELVMLIRSKSEFYNSKVREINALIGDSNHLAELVSKPVSDLPTQ